VNALVALFLIMTLTSAGFSECRYFRVSMKLLSCTTVDPKKESAKDPYPETVPESDELGETALKPLVRIRCDCDYSLHGSNALCDPDQTVERSSVIGAEKPEETCRRGKSLCKEVCDSEEKI